MPNWFEKHFERGRQQGLAEARAEAEAKIRAEYLLRVLAGRGIPVDDQSRHRIMSCTDVATLNQWFDRALKLTRLSDVLGDLAQ